ncbi:hypothetical protein DV711_01995 [Motiliproteus coralliicola]|uniref:UspA domain-containing protein n=1 Tax=Motiliproteus coralliicola TaxID=2283196 RepID=A0A369WV09_9GAMM|nr:universal stress protein [Motiliproteus coralliicola]RDE24384.1 hypothetical protein DV711_01995 [Motiliproteus coralliicola]
MRFNKNILVLVNPRKDQQVALDKAIRMCRRLGATITALVRDKHAQVPGLLEILDRKLEAAAAEGIEVSVKISDDNNWFRAIHRTLAEQPFGLVIKEAHKPTLADHVFLPDDWKLLRSTQHPVLLVHADNEWNNSAMLLCVDGNPRDQEHAQLNERIIKAGKLIGEVGQSQTHLFSAHPSTMQDVASSQPTDASIAADYRRVCRSLIDADRVPDQQLHIGPGPAELVIPELAQQLDAKLVVLGTVARSGLKGVLLGNTAEQVAKRLTTDLLVLPPET